MGRQSRSAFQADALSRAVARAESPGQGPADHQPRRRLFRDRRPRDPAARGTTPPGVCGYPDRNLNCDRPARTKSMKKLLLVMALLWGGGAFGVWVWSDARAQRITYRTVTVRRGDVRTTVNATGTIEPEEVVDVGAQVAGRIESFGADPADPSKPISYGSKVEQGTVLARLDT